jgi:transposase, IS30 family
MKKAKKLCGAERIEISILQAKGYGIRSIARAMNRSPNTISVELIRNPTNGIYNPKKADIKAHTRRHYAKYQRKKIEDIPALLSYVIERLTEGWNPDEISGRMKKEKKPFYASKTTIYEWIRSPYGQKYCIYLYSRRYYAKKQHRKKKREMIPDRIGIQQRCRGATDRSRYGHTEADTIVSGKQERSTAAVSVLLERKSRYIDAHVLSSLKPAEHIYALQNMTHQKTVKSITFDNGIENKYHNALSVLTFFCDPYSSWQKGGVENANKMIRRYLPKGTNLKTVSQEKLTWIVDRINNKPRKILGYRTAREVAVSSGYIISECPD